MIKELPLFILVIFLSSNSLLAQDDSALRYQAMDGEIKKIAALREKAMDEAVDRFTRKGAKPQFFFPLRNCAAGPSSQKTMRI